MFLETTEGKWKSTSVNAKCDECAAEYRAKISTALRQEKLVGHHQCKKCSSRRAGKKTAAKMSAIYSLWYSGDGNFAKKPGVGAKISAAQKGRKFSEERKASLRKPKSKTDKIIEAANRPEEVARRRNRMLNNNPMKNPECVKKMQETIIDKYANGSFDGRKNRYKTGWVENSKTKNPLWCRSGLEKHFLTQADAVTKIQNIESAECLRIKYEYEGKQRSYLPDFKVTMQDNSFVIVEIKSTYFALEPKWQYKKEALKQFCELLNINYVILSEKEIDKWLEQLKE